MLINTDLLPKLPIKTTYTSGTDNVYSCSYINDQLLNQMYHFIYEYKSKSTVNLNNCTTAGFYHFDVGNTYSNVPSGGGYPSINYFLLVFVGNKKGSASTANVTQLWFSTAKDYPGFWYRCCCWNTWTPWYSCKNT